LNEVDKAISKVRGEQPSASERFFSTLDLLFSVALPPQQGSDSDPDKRPSDSPYDDPRSEPPTTIHQAKREYTEALKDFQSKVSDLPTLRAGVYQHFKGGLYLVQGYAQDANSPREIKRNVVIYTGVSGSTPQARTWVRSVEDFFAQICTTTQLSERACNMKQAHDPVFAASHTHTLVPRFEYKGPA
jgi:hypothetical protein